MKFHCFNIPIWCPVNKYPGNQDIRFPIPPFVRKIFKCDAPSYAPNGGLDEVHEIQNKFEKNFKIFKKFLMWKNFHKKIYKNYQKFLTNFCNFQNLAWTFVIYKRGWNFKTYMPLHDVYKINVPHFAMGICGCTSWKKEDIFIEIFKV